MPKKAKKTKSPDKKQGKWDLTSSKPSQEELIALLEFWEATFSVKCTLEELRGLCASVRSPTMCFCLLENIAQDEFKKFESFGEVSSIVTSAYEHSKKQRNELLDSFQSGKYSSLLEDGIKIGEDDINKLFVEGAGAQTCILLDELIENISREGDEQFRFSSLDDILDVIRPNENDLGKELAKDIESTEWFYIDKNGARQGPLSTTELEPLMKNGIVSEKNLYYGISGDDHKPWFVIDNEGRTRGPLSEVMIVQGLEGGNFNADSHCYTEGMKTWMPLWKSDLSQRIDLIPFVPGLEGLEDEKEVDAASSENLKVN